MDVSSLNSDRAGQALTSCQSALVTTATSMGERQPISVVDKRIVSSPLKPIIGNMVVSKSDESDQNFYNYSSSSVLSEKKGLKILENSVKEKTVDIVQKSDCGSVGLTPNCVSPTVDEGGDDVCDDEAMSEKDDDDDPVECGDCDVEFASLQQYMDHPCSQSNNSKTTTAGSADDSELSDGESFDGKIVYNPDGSAYIIECDDSDLDDLDSIDVPKQEGAIVVDRKISCDAVPSSFPQIANAFFLSRNPQSFLNNYCTSATNSTKSLKHSHDAPIMHSYRVYDFRSGSSSLSNSTENHTHPSTSALPALTVPTKPILMCFICKLSFGVSKSFIAHANAEHTMTLSKEEKAAMSQRNASAIIQCVGKDKLALMSFLEPVAVTPVVRSNSSSPESSKAFPYYQTMTPSFLGKDSTSVSYVYSKPKISLSPSMETSNSSSSLAKEDQIDLKTSGTSIKQEVKNGESMDETNSASDAESDCSQSSKNGGSSMSLPSLVPAAAAAGSSAVTNSCSSQDSESLSQSKAEALNTSMLASHALSIASSVPSPSIHNPMYPPAFLRMCDEHPQGRVLGAECPKCDMVLSSSQSLGGHMTMMHSRNSCKTLKCPKCNWHYKYQETLEIHMKEKHPESDQQCIYCIANQPHPRLARGETYSCGYKPYRCEVCNYSTTTKGNLSIHMQSDKHINNMQELANGGQEVKLPQQPETYNNNNNSSTTPAVPDDVYKKIKPKQTWRCDVCNYETAVARNLRIHMTSEKHTHNMMVLQQNMKHMQRDMHLQINQLMMLGQQDPVLFGLPTQMAGGMFPYDQQMLASGIPAGFEVPVNLTTENGMGSGAGMGMPCTGEGADSARLFHCCVCNSYLTDSLDSLHQHLQHDRTKQRESEHISVASGSYLCNLCTYKTNLKANFQLHCKTDKHLQRVQLVNHIKEGGAGNEWRLKYLNVSNPVQVRCNACDYYTNSIHKLQMHTGSLQHESSAQLFLHLQLEESKVVAETKYYQCTLCGHCSKTKLGLIQHARSVAHIQKENLTSQQNDLDKPALEIGTVFVVKGLKEGEVVSFEEDGDRETPESAALLDTSTEPAEKSAQSDLQSSHKTTLSSSSSSSSNTAITTSSSSNHTTSNGSSNKGQTFSCPHCNYSSSTEQAVEEHIASKHAFPGPRKLPCPLCQDEYEKKADLEAHLVKSHNVKPEGLQRILSMLDIPQSSRQNHMSGGSAEFGSELTEVMGIDETADLDLELLEIEHTKMVAEDGFDMSVLLDKTDLENQYRCQTCSKTFTNIDQLYSHQNELGHLELKQTPRGPGYLCWKKGCNQYFKTAQALQIHFREIHAKRPSISSADCSQYSHQCSQCTMAFVSADKLQMHNQYHLVNSVTTCSICTQSFHSIVLLRKHYESAHPDVHATELAKHKMNFSANVAALMGSMEYRKFLMKYTKLSAVKSSASEAGSGLPRSASTEPGDQDMMEVSGMNEEVNDLDTSSSGSPDDHTDMGEDRDCETDRSDHPSVYREEQFMEDFINSQAMAEGSYEDPSRKFKCHRCKAAFTKQNYLTAHNKTLQHRRGDKISYPMERYLDPNRPFKCDICKESFTQKNILLVHYNSVSHLHKLKQAAQQGTLPPTISVGPPTTSSSQQSPVSSAESDQKPYRCNICKVAYNQGSTLDIHIRSVAHQTRASKIHELAMTGQIDISQMLIEQPDMSKATTQQVQALTDMISQTQAQVSVGSPLQHGSLLLSGIPGYSMLPGLQLPVVTSNSLMSPSSSSSFSFTSETDAIKASQKISHRKHEEHNSHSRYTAEGASEIKGFHMAVVKKEPHDELKESGSSDKSKISESQLFDMSKSLNSHHSESPIEKQLSNQHLTHRCSNCNSFFISEEALQIHQQIYCSFPHVTINTASKPRYICRFKPQLHRSLLQNIGFECVMQFNEYNQLKKEKTEKDDDRDNASINVEVKEEKKVDESNKIDLPEINKSTCLSCNKDFSSVWVLKAHQEEVHKDLVPIDAVEGFSEKFREDFDKKLPLEEPRTPTTSGGVSVSYTSSSNSDSLVMQEMPPPPPPPPPVQNPFDMSQLMPMFGMMPMPMPMNLMGLAMQAPLVSMMMPKGTDMSSLLPPVSVMDTNFTATQQQLQAAQNQKRVRTRISDEQLKILRGYFDINNSPSEEQIQQMSEQSGLPPKVIKHWFRNTLFKERQRNKDSPYNFSNPPSTSLDLEEYEKTGKIPTLSPVVVKQEPKDEFDDDVVDEDDDLPSSKIAKEIELEPNRENDQEHEKMEPLIKLETPKVEPLEDKSEFDTSSNASSPIALSTTSYINSTPTCSLPNTPTTEDLLRHEFSSGSMSKRANRTRFTDYQIKMLQDYFDQNAYPKDDELDHLSKMLNLSPRVIVVWFQNARQKVRKVYENQPAAETKDDSSYQRTPGLNYQCKKCQAVFQRYYELIKHQKRPCLPENNNTTTQSLMSSKTDDDSNSTSMSQDDLSQSGSFTDFKLSDAKGSPNNAKHIPTFNCDKCEASYNRLDLWQEHQKVHSLNPSLFPSFSSSSAFGMLQTLAQQEDNKMAAAAAKRKIDSEDDQDDQPRDKRLRTTILPEQLDYLYQKYQQDCNPSRKQLESISSDVGLKKRVVQVWFQNTRARERKGQYRAHQQLIHKRCPFCRALFRAKSAMESHLATKHPDEMAKNEINVDTIPDAVMDGSNPASPQPHSATPSGSSGHPGDFSKLLSPSLQQYLPFLPSPTNLGLSFPPDPLQLSMKQIYEDSFKKYISELSGAPPPPALAPVPPQSRHNSESGQRTETESVADEEAPLDLSKPIKVSTDMDKSSDGPSTDLSERSGDDHHNRRVSVDDSFSETQSETADMEEGEDSTSSPTSPANLGHHHRSHSHHQNKRYRTQMTSKQVKIMKLLFVDYKTPTMVECEMLGSEIGLQKRVVQVWFQNARAKEKKSKLAYSKTFGTDVDFSKPPDECTFCSFKYSHKFTVQDHIFTKKHINNVKAFIQSQADAEREMSDPTGMSTLLRQQQRDLDHSCKSWADMATSATTTPHLPQLQTIGMNTIAAADAVGIGRSLNLGTGHAGSDTSTPKKMHDTPRKDETESRKKEVKTEATTSSKQHEQTQAMVSAEMAMNAQMMALGGYLPGMDPSFLQYMYPGLPGYFPGMGLPMIQPGLFPGIGAEHMMAYDPLSFGTPLPLLQIPQQAIKLVSDKLEDPRSSLAQYTQDCKSISDLKQLVSSTDYSCAHETMVDVGYICKKCQIVYPAKEACVNHQRMVCFPGGKVPDSIKAMLKLEQVQYGCRACSDKFSTLYEFKIHCQMESHKVKVGKVQPGGKSRLDNNTGAASSSSSAATLTSASSSSRKSASSDVTNKHGCVAHSKPKTE